MKLIKFRIQDYKSVKDSGLCHLNKNDLTILAGKNESGKTSTLHALRDFANEDSISLSTRPSSDKSSIITCWFECNESDVSNILSESGGKNKDELANFLNKNRLQVIGTINYSDLNISYDFPLELKELLDNSNLTESYPLFVKDLHSKLLEDSEAKEDEFDLMIDELNLYYKDKFPYHKFIFPKLGKGSFSEFKELVNKKGVFYVHSSLSEERKTFLTGQKKLYGDSILILEEGFDVSNNLIKNIKNILPRFIFYNFKDEIRFETSINEALEIQKERRESGLYNFLNTAEINLAYAMKLTDENDRANYLDDKTGILSGDFKDFWKQDKIELVGSVSGDKFLINVKEDNVRRRFKPEERSDGFQWYLSFYLKLQSKHGTKKNVNNIILIDEPALHLHANAQEDVLKELERITGNGCQVMFSTHSPYLINSEKLIRVRSVFKDKVEGTKIKEHHEGVGESTLMPVLTSIGLNITQNNNIVRKRNVIVEGISDYYYLEAFRKLSKETDIIKDYPFLDEISFVHWGGVTQIPKLTFLFDAWNMSYEILVDNDLSGQKMLNHLEEECFIDSGKLHYISKTEGHSVEDLFTKKEFKNYCLNKPEAEYDMLNSHLVDDAKNKSRKKNNIPGKKICSKNFYDSITSEGGVSLSNTTVKKIEEVFDSLSSSIESSISGSSLDLKVV